MRLNSIHQTSSGPTVRLHTPLYHSTSYRPQKAAGEAAALLGLQRGHGNRYVQRRLSQNSFAVNILSGQANPTITGTDAKVPAISASHLQRAPKAPNLTDEVMTSGKRGAVFQAKVEQILVRFFIHPGETEIEKQIRPNLAAMTAQMTKMNALMADPAYVAQQLFIWTGATTGFRIVLGKPTLFVDSKYVIKNDIGAITHEMGHAVIGSYSRASTKEASTQQGTNLRNAIQKLAELYLQLKETKADTFGNLGVASDTLKKDSSVPLGHFMVDPSNWTTSREPEHPWDNFDEFFASAFEWFLLDRKGLERSVAKYAKKDARITALGKELIALLGVFQEKKYPQKGYSLKDKAKAEKEIERAGAPP